MATLSYLGIALHNHPFVLTSVVLFLPLLLLIYRQRRDALKLNLPCAGSDFRTPSFLLPIASLFWAKALIEDVYEKQKHEEDPQPYILPGVLGNEVMLPTSWIPWLASKPEAALSGKWSRIQRMNFDKTFMHSEVVTNPMQEAVIRRDLVANLDMLAPQLAEEIGAAVDELWGCDVEKDCEVDLEETVFRIVARASSRVFAGKKVSRDATFVSNSIRFTMVVITSGFVMKIIPKFLEPLLVRPLVSYICFHYAKLSRVLEPLFQTTPPSKQPPLTDEKLNNIPEHTESQGEVTAIQWLAENAARDSTLHTKEQTPKWLALRLTTLIFATVDTTSLTSLNLLLDIFTNRNSSMSFVDRLRSEAHRNSQLFGTRWDRARLNSMPCHDSALRESMRLSGFAVKMLQRKVMATEGITLPNGTVLPQGTMVCVSAWGLHHDNALYPQAMDYVPERFMASAAHKSLSVSDPDQKEGIEMPLRREMGPGKESMLLRTAAEGDNAFTFWGLGKQSCPGRYMAVDLIKILLDYVVTRYDVVPLDERPQNMWVEYNYVPKKVKITVRRRKE
ncbi:cytochrome P450 [Periconia macrospinosa]|uniref:Cytochrome P450 n=1 Tax=Periconia macrospinosa TaxID=97972 RepID=A0A2V1DCV0_9PLEO|nr:cytochrome P450 [Periconia macrospinosa]